MEISNLEDLLYEDWTWRKTEISELIIIAETEEKNVLLKSIILLLYAHWEGYIKKSSKTYLKFISDNKIEVSRLTDNFKYFAMKGLAQEVLKSSETLTTSNDISFIKRFNEINLKTIDKLIQINLENERDKSIIDTQDNLTPTVFKKILDIIGLRYLHGYEAKNTHIERNLVKYRNSIGHGNKKLSSSEDFILELNSLLELRDIIFLIIENFRDDIIQFAKEEYYLQKNISLIENYCSSKEEIISRELNAIKTRYLNE
jgi:hypothetical protein